MSEWLVERGIGETRSICVEKGEILETRIELDGTIRAGSIVKARLAHVRSENRNAVVRDERGIEYLLPKGAGAATEGSLVTIAVTREAIPGIEPWKRPLGQICNETDASHQSVHDIKRARFLVFPSGRDELADFGWNTLIEEARTGVVGFAGGELRIVVTPAMTLIDVDGSLGSQELAIVGAREAAKAICRLDIGGSIGIDLPTVRGKLARQSVAEAIDAHLPKPFERTAMNGFGFVQIVRPRLRASLVELGQDSSNFEARALLRGIAIERPGAKRVVANPSVIDVLEKRTDWIDKLVVQIGGRIELRGDASIPMSGGYAEVL